MGSGNSAMKFAPLYVLLWAAPNLVAAQSEVICPEGKSKTTKSLGLDEYVDYKTQDGAPGTDYTNGVNCNVLFKRKKGSDCELKFNCTHFDLKSAKPAPKCQDKIIISKKKYCQTTGPDVTVSGSKLKVAFKTNKKGTATGAVCTAYCVPPPPPPEAVMVRRLHKSGNPDDYFSKTFAEYKTGFSSNGELWLGLDELHRLTTGGPYGLRVTMKDWDDKEYTAVYSNFQVGPGDDYVLSVSGFESSSSTLGDAMAYHNGAKFSAKDRDVDTWNHHCSQTRGGGGWWYKNCCYTLPTGLNADVKMSDGKHIGWAYGGSRGYSWDSWKEAEFTVYKK